MSTPPPLTPKRRKNVLTLTQKIIAENHLTAMMVTHNMKDALEYGNRTIMMHEGKIILDIDAETKKRIHVEDLLVMFEKSKRQRNQQRPDAAGVKSEMKRMRTR